MVNFKIKVLGESAPFIVCGKSHSDQCQIMKETVSSLKYVVSKSKIRNQTCNIYNKIDAFGNLLL